MDILKEFLFTPGVAATLGITIAMGMIIGTSSSWLGLSKVMVGWWVIAGIVFLIMEEINRVHIVRDIGQQYSALPILLAGITFVAYVGGIYGGTWISHKYYMPRTKTRDWVDWLRDNEPE